MKLFWLILPVLLLSATTASAGQFDVGVIPDRPGVCPAGSDYLTIYMDDEDSGNASSMSGWAGAFSERVTTHVNGTTLAFCRVDGSHFFNLGHASLINWLDQQYTPAHASIGAYDYSVLKLGSTCPNGSIDAQRYIDNQSASNQNASTGNIGPSSQSGHHTTLYFCLFTPLRTGSIPTMATFPDVGIGYGVFGGEFSPPTSAGHHNFWISKGTVVTDDEDSGNDDAIILPNGYTQDQALEFQAGVSAGRNTTFYISKVRDKTKCHDPIAWWDGTSVLSWYDGAHCYVHVLVPGATALIVNNGYYITATPTTNCPKGTYANGRCFIGPKPSGGFVDGNAFYILVGSGGSCPPGYAHDPPFCYLPAPAGTTPFILNNGFYTTPLLGCPQAGILSGANCKLGQAPSGGTAFYLVAGYYYSEP